MTGAVARSGRADATHTIGDVLGILKPDFPDLTITKIRFLEDQELISPDRTPSGYRKYAPSDIARLRWVLEQQRDHYLPLKVIKEQLAKLDRGLLPSGQVTPQTAHVSVASVDGKSISAGHFKLAPASLRLTREELLNTAGLRGEQLAELEEFGLITAKGQLASGGASTGSGQDEYFDDDALAVATIVAALAQYGLEGRHLRAFRTAAEREVGLFGQIVGPMSKQRSSEARVRAEETVREMAALSVKLHAALVNIGLRSVISA